MYLSYGDLVAAKSIFYLHKTLEQPRIRCVSLQHHPTEQLSNINTVDLNIQDTSVTERFTKTDQDCTHELWEMTNDWPVPDSPHPVQ